MEDPRGKSWLSPQVVVTCNDVICSPNSPCSDLSGYDCEFGNLNQEKSNDEKVKNVHLNNSTHFPIIPLTPNPITPSPINQRRHSTHASFNPVIFNQQEIANLVLILSSLYGKLLVIMGIAFPMSEVISTYIPHGFYDGFYLYLYFVSIAFMMCVYGNILRLRAKMSVKSSFRWINFMRQFLTPTSPPVVMLNVDEISSERRIPPMTLVEIGRRGSTGAYSSQRTHFGSFYLRMGAVAFGVGSMIYSGLEFGQYFEVESVECNNVLIAITPSVRMIFTFMQMYFIFLNSKMILPKERFGVQIGLIHMISTNLCVWLYVLVQETRHEILNFYNPDKTFPEGSNNETAEIHKQGLGEPHSIYDIDCRRTEILGSLLQGASPFLFPCTIEYSLICAAILYVMWKNTQNEEKNYPNNGESILLQATRPNPNHYSADCARANKGLFLGILFFVLTIISLILFFVLVTRPGYESLATLEVNITELFLYTFTTVAVLIGMYQIRELRFVPGRNMELDNILLIGAQTGLFIYNMFSIICGYFSNMENSVFVILTALASLIQLIFQTFFIIDASKRTVVNADQARRKPGREIVTFLLVANLAMWAVNTLEKSRADTHPVQLQFYGVWAWTIITHISMPLAIFYRFHSTVCLCEIWKKAYKVKSGGRQSN